MTEKDKYFTVEGISTGIFKDRGSKFIAFALPVSSVNETKQIIEKYRKEYHDAKHCCYAYVIGHDKSIWRQNDDGEPPGTAGKPIFSQIYAKNLTNIIVVVVRYFGGTLLGKGGLINAYKSASSEALCNARIIEHHVRKFLKISCSYSRLNTVMKILNDSKAILEKQEFSETCVMKAGIRKSLIDQVIKKLRKYEEIDIEFEGEY
ncbi:MAG: YigZ family protein [Bacteroidales bacterium]